MFLSMYVCAYVCMCVHMYVCVCICMYVCAYVCMCCSDVAKGGDGHVPSQGE